MGSTILDAVIHEKLVLYTTFARNMIHLQILRYPTSPPGTQGRETISQPGDDAVQTVGTFSAHVTCVAVCCVGRKMFAIIAEWLDTSILLSFVAIEGGDEQCTLNITAFLPADIKAEALISVAVAVEAPEYITLLCGTRNGLILTFKIAHSPFSILKAEHYRIGATSVTVKIDKPVLAEQTYFASCDSSVYAITIKERNGCYLGDLNINQIWLTDALDPGFLQPNITSFVGHIPLVGSGTDGRIMFVVGSQLLIASMGTEARAVPRHLHIGGTPSRMLYSENLHVFIVAATVEGRSTILFIDPKTGEDLAIQKSERSGTAKEGTSKQGDHPNHVDRDSNASLTKPGEQILRLFEWSYVKDLNTWNYILASTSAGRVLVISIEDESRVRSEIRGRGANSSMPGISDRSKIVYSARYRFKSSAPVYSVTGFPDGLLWCSGEKLFCEVLDLGKKKFRRVTEYDLPSPANNLTFVDGTIYALTQEHSLEVLQLNIINGTYTIERKCGDHLSRYALHHVPLYNTDDRPLHLVSDKSRSVFGLWPTKDAKADTLETVFEAQLPNSMLRLRTTRCRPPWDPVWSPTSYSPSSSLPPSSVSSSEVLGLSIYGSVVRFTVLDFTAWKFLRFVISLCQRSPTICEFSFRDDPIPVEVASEPKKTMHVDGDILKRCLDERRLEELLCLGSKAPEASRIISQFFELLQLLHRGALDETAAEEVYIQQAYDDLDLYLRPTI